jgi:uncharacterized protein YdhG (YjbR/CyaY superfamily)
MWQCPKCGRSFKKENQNHSCGIPLQTIEDYIAAQPEHVQPVLNQVRDMLRTALPEAEERISWRMPTYWCKQNIIHFAAFKNHFGIYPGDKAIEHFADKLTGYKTSKGAWQLLYDQPIPLDLIAEMARWCFLTGHHH